MTYQELLFLAKYLGTQGQYGSPIIPSAIVVGAIYVGLCLILSGIAKFVEAWSRRSPKASKGVEEKLQLEAENLSA